MSVPSAGTWESGAGNGYGLSKTSKFVLWSLVYRPGAEGTDPVRIVHSAPLLASELGRGERQDLWASESHRT